MNIAEINGILHLTSRYCTSPPWSCNVLDQVQSGEGMVGVNLCISYYVT